MTQSVCPNCGASISSASAYCDNCGARLSISVGKNNQDQSPLQNDVANHDSQSSDGLRTFKMPRQSSDESKETYSAKVHRGDETQYHDKVHQGDYIGRDKIGTKNDTTVIFQKNDAIILSILVIAVIVLIIYLAYNQRQVEMYLEMTRVADSATAEYAPTATYEALPTVYDRIQKGIKKGNWRTALDDVETVLAVDSSYYDVPELKAIIAANLTPTSTPTFTPTPTLTPTPTPEPDLINVSDQSLRGKNWIYVNRYVAREPAWIGVFADGQCEHRSDQLAFLGIVKADKGARRDVPIPLEEEKLDEIRVRNDDSETLVLLACLLKRKPTEARESLPILDEHMVPVKAFFRVTFITDE